MSGIFSGVLDWLMERFGVTSRATETPPWSGTVSAAPYWSGTVAATPLWHGTVTAEPL